MASRRRKKKTSTEKIIVNILLWLVLIILTVYFSVEYFTKPPKIFYPGFEISIPPGYQIHGIDVSRYQKIINWRSVKEMKSRDIRIGFAFIKATEGINKVDPQFRRNWQEAAKNNLPKGAYHFFVATKSGKKQAANFIQNAELRRGDLPPVIDIEKSYGAPVATIQKELKAWLLDVEFHYKVKPIIYTNIDFYENYLEEEFSEYPLWIAHYLQPQRPRLEHTWAFWQHSEQGRVNGIVSQVDFNVFSGDTAAFRDLLIK